MLVLTRREGEEIVLGDPKKPTAVIRVATIKGDRVRIGVEADRDVPINRREVADLIAAGVPPQVR